MPDWNRTKPLLQGAVAIFALIPVGAGLSGVLLGAHMTGDGAGGVSHDSHFRYLSGLLLGIGLAFLSCIPRIHQKQARFRLLTLIVFSGGLARLLGLYQSGLPSNPMLLGLMMELVVTPLLCLWQGLLDDDAGALHHHDRS